MNFFAKTLALLAGLTVATVAVSNLSFSLTAGPLLVEGLRAEALALAVEGADRVDGARYAWLLADPERADSLAAPIRAELSELQARYGRHGVENVYVLAMHGGRVVVAGDPAGEAPPLSTADTVLVGLKRAALASGRATACEEPYSDAWGTWISGYAPVRDGDGRAVALLGMDLPLGAFSVMNEIIARNVVVSLLLGLVLALAAGTLLARRLTRPVTRLANALDRVADGDLDVELPEGGADELGRLATHFNAMMRSLREKGRIRALFQRSVSPEIADALIGGRVKTDGELREVTVLYADIRGFTALSEALAARDVIALLRRYYDGLVPAVTAAGGVVDKFVGDEIFALFGAPLQLPDDVASAVACALDMRERLAALNRQLAAEGRRTLEIGIGVNTGAAVAGNLGSRDRMNYTVVGQAVNIGARLVAAAEPGQILVSEAVWLRLQGRVRGTALEPIAVKNVTYPLRVFAVDGLDPLPARSAS